ncbi:MAG: allophanate hydrolase [Pseudomonadota bacterium]
MAETLSAHALTLDALRDAYTRGTSTPAQVIDAIHARAARFADRNMWIRPVTEAELSPYLQRLADSPVASLPLWGVPFVIKDNIDLAGIPTTAGCPAFGYTPTASAFVVQQLIDAGAIPVAKANLDQFATGLNGTRSPHGPCRNAFDADFVSGGSSSGSAVSVALGLASFSLGTDTAGSGRVPACFNNLVGLKPTRGLLSASGSVPACRSLDCISVFALTAADANAVLACAEGQDTSDGYSRANRFDNSARQFGRRSGPLRVGVIPEPQLQFFGDEAYQAAYARSLARLQADGITVEEVDYAPFAEAAALLYEGPWVSERYIAMEGILRTDPEAVFPTVRSIVEPGAEPRATDLFRAQYRLAELQGVCAAQLARFDCLLTPTAGRLFTVAEMLEEPIKRNSELGYYTNFMNLLDMAAVSVPTAFTEAGLPFGITVAGPAFSDRALLSIAQRIQDL